jgi:hypothetical protein
MKKPTESPLARLVEAASRQAAEKVIKRAIECGTPVIVWEDEQIKRVDPRNMRIPRAKGVKPKAEE